MGAEVKPREDDPALFRDNVYHSWHVMSYVVNHVTEECFVAHLEPNPGVRYDCLSLVTRDSEGQLRVRFMLNRNGANGLIGSYLFEDVWGRVTRDGFKKVADEIISLAGLTSSTGRVNSVSSTVCNQVLRWIRSHRYENFYVGPLDWPGSFAPLPEIKRAAYSKEQWPIPDHGPEISMGISGRELQRLEMLTSGTPSKEDPKNTKIFKVTTINGQGDEMIAYVRESYKHSYFRSMMEEYGNSVAVEIDIEDIPADVNFPQ